MIVLILTMGLMTNSIGYAYEDKPDLYVLYNIIYFIL